MITEERLEASIAQNNRLKLTKIRKEMVKGEKTKKISQFEED